MKRKYTLITAAICLGTGILIILVALCWIGFDFTMLNTVELESKTMDISAEVQSVEIFDSLSDVSIVPSSDSLCHVYFKENETFSYSITVENGKLTIRSTASRKWYEQIGLHIDNGYSLTVALPIYSAQPAQPFGTYANYDALCVQTVSGDISVSRQLHIEEVTLYSTSGDIRCEVRTSSLMSALGLTQLGRHVETVSGDIHISNVGGSGCITTIFAKSTSGDITISDLQADTLSAQSVSGDLELSDIEMESATLKTVSGDIRLALPHTMNFVTKTTSGSVKTPGSSPNEGVCELVTTSGDIEVYLLTDNMKQAS